MNAQELQSATFLDILFEDRNKQYGAYILRKNYHSRLWIGLITTVGLSLVLGFALTKMVPEIKDSAFIYTPVELIKIDDKIPEKPIPIEPQKTTTRMATIKDVVPIVVPNPIADAPVPTQEEKENTLSSSVTRDGEPTTMNTPITTVIGVEGNNSRLEPAPVEPEIYETSKVEEQAEFPGGKEGLSRFLKRNLVSPSVSENSRIQVMVKFVVAIDGSIAAIEILKDGGRAYDDEVLRVVRKMPRWKPAKQHGKAVAMYFVLPVTFVAELE